MRALPEMNLRAKLEENLQLKRLVLDRPFYFTMFPPIMSLARLDEQ